MERQNYKSAGMIIKSIENLEWKIERLRDTKSLVINSGTSPVINPIIEISVTGDSDDETPLSKIAIIFKSQALSILEEQLNYQLAELKKL